MKVDSFYTDFNGWLEFNHASQAAAMSNYQNLTTEDWHELWLIAIGLDETSWFMYCGQYDTEMFEDD